MSSVQYIAPAWLIGSKIKEARKECGMSQSQLAKQMGVTPQMVSKWETGKSIPKYETISKLAECFHTDVAHIIGFNDVFPDAEIIQHYNALNPTGKAEAVKRVEELTHIEKYVIKEEPSK